MKSLFHILLLLLAIVSCKKDKVSDTQPSIVADAFGPEEFMGKHKAKVSVLGVFHFDNPGLDGYKPEFPFNILQENRQKELKVLLNALEVYRPTKILVEVSRIKRDSSLNVKYQGYLNGSFDAAQFSSETYQIGFKLAKLLGHERIYASDTEPVKWCGVDLDWNTYDEESYLSATGNLEKSRRYNYNKKYRFQDSLKSEIPLIDFLRFKNTPSNRLKDHQAYLTEVSLIGAGDLYIGADAVARWYQRNIRIFANTYDLADLSKEERILLIYGSGHVWTLKQMFTDSPDFEYVEINDYLNQ